MDKYYSVSGGCVTEKVIEKSRFITHSRHVENDEQARAFVAEISKKYSDATHNCYAYIADEGTSLMRFSDDGEPQGTAGMPMLEVLKAKKLAYTAVVVTRYFGGIKLGAGGLVRAYSGCVAENLNAAAIKSYELCCELMVETDYANSSAAARFLNGAGCELLSTEYLNGVVYTVAVRSGGERDFIKKLTDALNGRVKTRVNNRYFYPFDF